MCRFLFPAILMRLNFVVLEGFISTIRAFIIEIQLQNGVDFREL
jgi:hypothetical protein